MRLTVRTSSCVEGISPIRAERVPILGRSWSMYSNDRSSVSCRAPGRFIDCGSIGQVAEPQLARRTSAAKNAVTAKPTRAARSAAQDKECMQAPPGRSGLSGRGVRRGAGVPPGGKKRTRRGGGGGGGGEGGGGGGGGGA